MSKQPIRATDINRAIKARYSGPEWRVWFEVSEGTGAFSGRRADAVVMNIWPSKAYQLHVFEVKVSRADFKKEMEDLTKWKAIGCYSDFFWLATPVGLVKPEEVPEGWGLIELTKGGLRIKKQAPARDNPTPLDRPFAASLLRSGEDLTEKEIERRVTERVDAQIPGIREAAERGYNRSLDSLKTRTEKMEEWKAEFERHHGIPPNPHARPEDMAARMQFAANLEQGRYEGLGRQARALADLIDKLDTPPNEDTP